MQSNQTTTVPHKLFVVTLWPDDNLSWSVKGNVFDSIARIKSSKLQTLILGQDPQGLEVAQLNMPNMFYCLPNGLVRTNETLCHTARRILQSQCEIEQQQIVAMAELFSELYSDSVPTQETSAYVVLTDKKPEVVSRSGVDPYSSIFCSLKDCNNRFEILQGNGHAVSQNTVLAHLKLARKLTTIEENEALVFHGW